MDWQLYKAENGLVDLRKVWEKWPTGERPYNSAVHLDWYIRYHVTGWGAPPLSLVDDHFMSEADAEEFLWRIDDLAKNAQEWRSR